MIEKFSQRAYPVWVISARWDNKEYKNNGTSFTVSYRVNFSEATMHKKARRWFEKMVAKKFPGEKIEPNELKVRFIEKAVWYGMWFHHRSLNLFPDEATARKSFQDYFWSLKQKRGDRDYDANFITPSGYEYCVMGAQDYWRWKYCGCKQCKRLGITIIKH
jgi:hypothetical protein